MRCKSRAVREQAHEEPAGWVLSLEVGEHLPPALEHSFVLNLHRLNHRGIVLSWAAPHQAGKAHVNCHSKRYLKTLFERDGLYVLDVETTSVLSRAASAPFYRRNVQVFRRRVDGPWMNAPGSHRGHPDLAQHVLDSKVQPRTQLTQ